MKKLIILAAIMPLIISCKMENNPLLTPSELPYGAPQFDKIKTEHYLPAFTKALQSAKEEIDAIVNNPAQPDFFNTIEALEFAGEDYNNAAYIFYNILEADATPELQDLAEQISPMDNELSTYVNMNQPLFKKVKTVYEKRETLGLNQEQSRLLEKTYKSFVRGGANLPEDKQKELSEINDNLSLLSLQYGKNLLAATNSFVLNVTEEADVAGLPQYMLDMGLSTAKEKGLSGWAFDLSQPSYSGFMKYSTRRDLREKIYRAYNTRGLAPESDNTVVAKQLVELRIKKANLLGYASWADYVISDRMAGSKEGAYEFMDKLRIPTMPVARQQIQELNEYARQNGFEFDELQPWDFAYWAEKLQTEKYSISDEELKPYFNLEYCIPAVFDLAHRLYGINFTERTDIPAYHPDVKVYDVTDSDGSHLALFYADFFPRSTKRGGAWMTEFRGQKIKDGVEMRPFINIVTNFTKPTGDTPALITHDELTTFLHEFGHALHGMLAQGSYLSLTGTNVDHDFVELPSQIMENWAFEEEYLSSFARHYQTGEIIPQSLIQKIIDAQNYMAAYYQSRQQMFGYLDLAWHSLETMTTQDVFSFEREATSQVLVLPPVEGCCTTSSISHLFSGGYSAGYYSYKWAEVLAADAYSLFQEKGIFDPETAAAFRKLLETGDAVPAAELYRTFRGHDPQPDALLKKLDIIQ